MANELLTRDDIVRGKKNFDAQNAYMTGTAEEQVTLPDGQKIKTRAGIEKEITDKFDGPKAGLLDVGTENGNVAVMTPSGVSSTGWGASSTLPIPAGLEKLTDLYSNGLFSINNVQSSTIAGLPTSNRGVVMNISYINSAFCFQAYHDLVTGSVHHRTINRLESETSVSEWALVYSNKSKVIYTNTTATSANTVVTPNGELQRSTSSAIFKKDIADIHIDDYRAALKAVRPVSYRSTDATSDRTDWSWYSFIAEELGALDKRLVQMDSVEFFEDTNEDGSTFINSRELPEGEYAANGINTNGIVALMVHINQQMLVDIEKLEDEKTQLKRRTTNLEKRMDAIDGPAA